MVFNLILASAILIALIAFYFENNTAIKVKNGVVLGVTLPYSEIKNNEVLKIVEEYKKRYLALLQSRQARYFFIMKIFL